MAQYTKNEWAAKKNQETEEIFSIINQQISDYKENPEHLSELLEFKSKFYDYSIQNVMLIQRQNPYATYVTSYTRWKEFGYNVLKGQKGIMIRAPKPLETFQVPFNGKWITKYVSQATPEEKEAIKNGSISVDTKTVFTTEKVFDISQTNCPKEKYPEFFSMGYPSEQHAKLCDIMMQYAKTNGIEVTVKDLSSISLRGQYIPGEHKIELNDKLNDTEKLSTLTHELGHALTEKQSTMPDAFWDLQADCVSILLHSKLGLEVTESRKRHFTEHFHACETIPGFKLESFLKTINKEYNKLCEGIEPMLDDFKPEVQHEIHSERTQNVSSNTKPQSKYDFEKMRSLDVLDQAQKMGYTITPVGNYYSLKEHDSVIIYPKTNSYHRFSTGKGGSVIDFVMEMGQMDKKQAFEYLHQQLTGDAVDVSTAQHPTPKQAQEPKQPKPFTLPPACEGKYSRLFSYLIKTRGIDSKVVSELVNNKKNGKSYIYEDENHNVVFVGKDYEGKDAYASRRSTIPTSTFRGEAPGSNQSVGWGIHNASDILYVCEAPIDAISLMCLNNNDTKTMNYLAMGGTGKDKSVYNFLDHNRNIKHVILANDNDEAGLKADEKISSEIAKRYSDIKVTVLKPEHGKDVNEELLFRKQATSAKQKEVHTL